MSRLPLRPIAGTILAISSVMPSSRASAQALPFDRDRAWVLDSTMYQPFFVESAVPLQDALRQRLLHDESPILVVDHPAGRLALSTEQMAYHHAAQGDFAGEAWMVSF